MMGMGKKGMMNESMGICVEGDSGLVLTTDPKPRLRWTAELHEGFVDAVSQLGGPDSAETPSSKDRSTREVHAVDVRERLPDPSNPQRRSSTSIVPISSSTDGNKSSVL